MTRIRFVEHDGTLHLVEAADGTTVMQAALDNMVPGIVGECGGFCSCGTCLCQVEPGDPGGLAPPGPEELAVLDGLLGLVPGSRLGCQITLTPGLDGLVVRLPKSQLY